MKTIKDYILVILMVCSIVLSIVSLVKLPPKEKVVLYQEPVELCDTFPTKWELGKTYYNTLVYDVEFLGTGGSYYVYKIYDRKGNYLQLNTKEKMPEKKYDKLILTAFQVQGYSNVSYFVNTGNIVYL